LFYFWHITGQVKGGNLGSGLSFKNVGIIDLESSFSTLLLLVRQQEGHLPSYL